MVYPMIYNLSTSFYYLFGGAGFSNYPQYYRLYQFDQVYLKSVFHYQTINVIILFWFYSGWWFQPL